MRRILVAGLSAVFPGAGQLTLGQRRKGIWLLLGFAALVACVWPLRAPRFVGSVLLVFAWLGLALYASGSAVLMPVGQAAPRPSKWWLLAIAPLVYVGINLVFTPLFLVAGFRALRFDSTSMRPTLLVGDCFVIDKEYYRFHAPAINDLVVVPAKRYQTVKRVIAVAGDTIQGRERQIVVNGKILDEPFIEHSEAPGTNPEMDTFGPITVAAGKLFLMGDNRDVSLDSRLPEFGLIDVKAVLGKPLYIYRSRDKSRRGKYLN
jgi:signal peptidase I